MRMIDETKKKKIEAAVYRIVMEEGVSAVSFGKISRLAGVSPGTPYVYFANKTDMLTRLFLNAKDIVDEGVKEDIEKGITIEEKIYQCVYHFVVMFHKYPQVAAYIRAINGNYSLLNPEYVKTAGKFAEPVEELFLNAVSAGMFANADRDCVASLLFGPVFYFIDQRKNMGKDWTPEDMEQIIRLSVKAVLK